MFVCVCVCVCVCERERERERERENPLSPIHGLLFSISSKTSFICPTLLLLLLSLLLYD